MNWAVKKELILYSLLFFLMIFLSISGFYFASSTPRLLNDEFNFNNNVDLTISEVIIKQFDAKGALAQFIESPVIKHIPNNDTHLIDLPHIVIHQPNKPAWDIRSKQATSIQNGKEITFNQQVTLHQDKSETVKESNIHTEQLIYLPREKIATTDKQITFHQLGTVIHSLGMQANLGEKQRIHLSKARANYEPNQG